MDQVLTLFVAKIAKIAKIANIVNIVNITNITNTNKIVKCSPISLSPLLLPVAARFFNRRRPAQVDVNMIIVVEGRADEPTKRRGRKAKRWR